MRGYCTWALGTGREPDHEFQHSISILISRAFQQQDASELEHCCDLHARRLLRHAILPELVRQFATRALQRLACTADMAGLGEIYRVDPLQ